MRRLKTSELASHQGSWLIFDFGNVLIEIDPTRSIEAFQTLGAQADLHLDADIFHDFETGILSAAGFRDALRGQLGRAASRSSLDAAWNALLLEIPPRTLHVLRSLRAQGYRLALLSNTNPIHIDEVRRRLGPLAMANSRAALSGFFTPTKWVCANPIRRSMPRWTVNWASPRPPRCSLLTTTPPTLLQLPPTDGGRCILSRFTSLGIAQ